MTGLALSILALIAAYTQTVRSLGRGISALLVTGYFYGLLRAIIFDGFSHFIFDAAMLGVYVGAFTRRVSEPIRQRSAFASNWLWLLIGWPVIYCLVPLNHPVVQVVGLRSVTFLLPCILLGARLEARDLPVIAQTLAVLNLVALLFGAYEFAFGVQAIFPQNAATIGIYRAVVATTPDELYLRIPATFSSAHHYGGTMVASAPFLINYLLGRDVSVVRRWLILAGLVGAAVGTFLCGARSPAAHLVVLAAAVLLMTRPSPRILAGLGVSAVVTAYVVLTSPRFQRVLTLTEDGVLTQRLGGQQFALLDLVFEYPLGAGLGSAFGTSIPYFLQEYAAAVDQIGIESEFARIALEQTIVGLLLWWVFFAFLLLAKPKPVSQDWVLGTASMRVFVALVWLSGYFGAGMFNSLPSSCLFLLEIGILTQFRNRAALAPAPQPAAPPGPHRMLPQR